MSHSLTNDPDRKIDEDSSNTLPVKESEDDPPINDANNVGNDWLTFRRRCELCKQRKVRRIRS